MVYVDLNPIRAGIALSPEASSYTSIQERLAPVFDLKQAIQSQLQCGDLLGFKSPLKPLLQFEDRPVNQTRTGIHFAYQDYLELVDWTGRNIRQGKRGYIDPTLPPILNRLHISSEQWGLNTTQFEAIHAGDSIDSYRISIPGKYASPIYRSRMIIPDRIAGRYCRNPATFTIWCIMDPERSQAGF